MLTFKKRCLSCAAPFALSGSGRRQKYCPNCSRSGVGRVLGSAVANPLILKGAKSGSEKDLGAFVRAQIVAAVDRGDSNPIPFTTPCGKKCRVWLGHDFTLGLPNFERALKANRNRPPKIGDDRHWRVNVGGLLDQEEKRKKVRSSPKPWSPTASALNRPIIVVGRNGPIKDMDDALGVAKGYRIRICIEAEKELQILGCGWRIVTAEFDGDNVLLHHNGNTATMKRPAFKALIAANKRLRRKRPVLRLVISNPPPVVINSEAA